MQGGTKHTEPECPRKSLEDSSTVPTKKFIDTVEFRKKSNETFQGVNMWFTFAIIAAILWGFNYALAEKILKSISPTTLLALEMIIGAVLFTCISFFTTMKKDIEILTADSSLLLLTIAEIAIVLIASYFITTSINLKNATIAGIVELTYPIFTIIFTWFLFNQNHVNLSVILGGLLIFAGVLIISLA